MCQGYQETQGSREPFVRISSEGRSRRIGRWQGWFWNGGTHPGNHRLQFSRARIEDQILNVPYRHMCCMLVPQLVALFWEVLDSLGLRSICKKHVLAWEQALGAYPWCFLSRFLLPVIRGMRTFPRPQAPATCHRVLPWSMGCRRNLRSHQVKESFPPLSHFSWGFWSFQQEVTNRAYSGGFHTCQPMASQQKATCSSHS